jgi:hypothetical protein
LEFAERTGPVHNRTAALGGATSSTARQGRTVGPDAEYHALLTGHFALEDKATEIAALMRDFLARTVPRA